MLLFAVTILVSAFLLFQIQPVIAKAILPWFGGLGGVWAVCLVFFQTVLLLGYTYAHLLATRLRPRAQWLLHTCLLAASVLFLPVAPDASWKPEGSANPALLILTLLAATVGLPYLLLSSTGPLIQAWFSRRFPGRPPYRLYALSNLGSMAALASYPLVVEPRLPTHTQALWWSGAYGLFAVLCAVTAYRVRDYAAAQKADNLDPAKAPAPAQRVFWMALAAVASALLLAITNHLSQNVAAIPFLWVLPLTIYLLTFIICFDRERWYARGLFLKLLAVALGSMAYALSDEFENSSVQLMVPLFSVGLFVACMFCHGELARRKPHPRYLTSYYLMISLGGALGGMFVALVAPALFAAYYELHIALAACAVLAVMVLYREMGASRGKDQALAAGQTPARPLGLDFPPETAVAAEAAEAPESAAVPSAGTMGTRGWFRLPAAIENSRWSPSALAPRLGWGMATALAGGMIAYLGALAYQAHAGNRVMVRNFYGGLITMDEGVELTAHRKLMNGTINHGQQYLSAERRTLPTTYYGARSGVGIVTRVMQERGPVRIGVIGLGTGTMAAWGRPGDVIRFYEINPLVLDIARTEFTFLKDSPAKTEVVMGDARLSLEREPPQNYHILAVDAFSSDSIPVHLLTREACQLYFQHIAPGGVLAVHVSNRYLELEPVVKRIADSLGRHARVVDAGDNEGGGEFGSTWVLVTSDPGIFKHSLLVSAGEIENAARIRLWTDDYSNLFQILK